MGISKVPGHAHGLAHRTAEELNLVTPTGGLWLLTESVPSAGDTFHHTHVHSSNMHPRLHSMCTRTGVHDTHTLFNSCLYFRSQLRLSSFIRTDRAPWLPHFSFTKRTPLLRDASLSMSSDGSPSHP